MEHTRTPLTDSFSAAILYQWYIPGVYQEEAMKKMETFLGMLIPFLGTTLGSACVFFMKNPLAIWCSAPLPALPPG